MRKIFDDLMRTLRHFVRQRDDLMLLVPCNDSDIALVLKALRDLDRMSSGDLFLLFAQDFDAPASFVTSLAASIEEERTLINEATGPDVEKLPPLPSEMTAADQPPEQRLEAGMRYAQSLVQPRQGQHFVWGMGPGKIADAKSYLNLLATLAPQPDVLPWMRGARIIARVPPDFQLDKSPLAKCKRVNVEPFVIPHDVHEKGLLADAADPKLPMADRMQAEVQLAYLDYAHGRLDMAAERFNKTLAYFQWVKLPVMEGLIICGMGDIERRKENWKQANHWYECATVPAAEAGSPILLANIVQNLALVAYHEKRFTDAEERYGELATLKKGMLDEVGLAEALEWQGLCGEKQEAYDRAVEAWEEGALVCKAFEMKDRLPPMLAHVRRGYEKLNMKEELKHFDEIWNS